MLNKITTSAEAVKKIRDGDLVIANFWGPGTPIYLWRALLAHGAKDLTLCINNYVPKADMLREAGTPDPSLILDQTKKIISAYASISERDVPHMVEEINKRLQEGALEFESMSHGNLVERLYAAAFGLGGIYSPIGVGTVIEEGKEKRVINDKAYLFQEPLRPDVALISAARADTLGNLVYHGTARASNPIIAMASRYVIAEVYEIVQPGELDPDQIVTPGAFVDRVVQIPDDDPAGKKRRKEWIAAYLKFKEEQTAKADAEAPSFMERRLTDEQIAMRAARELAPGDYCNLGVGIPLKSVSYIADGVKVQSENGVTGYGPVYENDELDLIDPDMIEVGMRYFRSMPGMAFFDQLTSFSMIRSGRLTSILGGLQVSEKGDVAIHTTKAENKTPSIGGSMDLAWGASRLIIAMTHNAKDGSPKVVCDLTLPVTARACADLIITDIAVIQVTKSGLVLKEFAPGWTPEEVAEQTGAPLTIAGDVKEMEF